MGKKLSFKGELSVISLTKPILLPPVKYELFKMSLFHYSFTIRTNVFKVSIVELLSIMSKVILTIK